MNKFFIICCLTSMVSFSGLNANAAKLAEREEMSAQLATVDVGTPYLEEKFYPYLLKHAGSEKNPMGIVMMFTLANHDYLTKLTRGMPPQLARTMLVTSKMHLDLIIPKLIKAILPNDIQEAEEAAKLFDELSS